MTDIDRSFTELYEGLHADALTAARATEGAEGRSGSIAIVASRTHPLDAALPLWAEAADAAREIDDPSRRVIHLTGLLQGLRSAAK